jgi:hypothetical protein
MIICTEFCNGKKHDFRLYKESRIYEYTPESIIQKADTAYKSKDYPNIITPHKKPPKKRKTISNPKPESTHLTKEQKQENKELSSKRTQVENIIGDIKLFKIHSEKYRNRGKKVCLRYNLTCGLNNH